ncbi:stage V sporulation protein AE [Bacillus alveayuensis]|jgi:stage V sporulation protein AE|uniref:stage V sporulation protein AE n=1 Tax=Aeribacillus alveayuensis TaxID=279215 RepID=UPI0005CCB05E|nr:stage V sporulation protein AE [Bacillus alveayuensis]
MEYVLAFLVGGIICVLGQLAMDIGKFSPIHVMSMFVVLGALLGSIGVYDWLVSFAGAGAVIPISGFGYALMDGVTANMQQSGLLGIGTGIFAQTGVSFSAAILFSFLVSLIFKPKG